MTISDKRRGGGPGADMAQQAMQRALDTNVPDHVKTGIRLTGISIGAAGQASVPHKLGRKPTGWQKMRQTGSGDDADLIEVSSDAKTITFRRSPTSTGTLTFDIWVF